MSDDRSGTPDLLQDSWLRLLDDVGAIGTEAYLMFDMLAARYQEPHRHYHNLEHIAEMLNILDRLADLANDVVAVRFAIWFHDAVFDPKSSDNEDRSAELAIHSLRELGIPEDRAEHVAALIRSTKHESLSVRGSDVDVLLDADLAILGAEERRYRRYAKAIQREYSWVDEATYRAGRIRVLKMFLARPRIYKTERMFALGEEVARRNMRAELESLSA